MPHAPPPSPTSGPSARPPLSMYLGNAVQRWTVADALDRLSLGHRAVLVEAYYEGRRSRRLRSGSASRPARSNRARTMPARLACSCWRRWGCRHEGRVPENRPRRLLVGSLIQPNAPRLSSTSPPARLSLRDGRAGAAARELGRIDAAEARDRLLTPSPDLPHAGTRRRRRARAEGATPVAPLEDGCRGRRRRGGPCRSAAPADHERRGRHPDRRHDRRHRDRRHRGGRGEHHQRAWGTAVHLEPTGCRPRRATAPTPPPATGAGGGGQLGRQPATAGLTVIGTSAIPRNELASIDIRTIDGRPLLTLPC